MLSAQANNTLRLRKQLLLLESELNRAALRDDLNRIRQRTGWLRSLESLTHKDRGASWLSRAAPMAGVLAAALSPGSRWMTWGLRVAQVAAAAYPLWKAFSARGATHTPPSDPPPSSD